jgi:phosphoglycolate phosphatase
MSFELVLFDLDGTLVETAPEICDAVNDTLRDLKLPEVELGRVCDWIGHGTGELLLRALAHAGNTGADTVRASSGFTDAKHRFDRHYQQRCGTRSRLYPHVREALLALRSGGVKLAVVTNKEGRYTRTVLEALQLSPLFDRVISGDSFPAKKPDPAGVLSCLEQFQVAASRTLFVGDSSIDVATARAAGVTVWALPYGYNMGKPIQDCGPDRVIQDFSALMSITAGVQKDVQIV